MSEEDAGTDRRSTWWHERRRSFLKQIGSGLGLSAVGGATIATESASAGHGPSTFQADFVERTSVKQSLDGTTYSDDSRLVNWVWGDPDTGGTAEDSLHKEPYTQGDCSVSTTDGVDLDHTNNEASVSFDTGCGSDDIDLSLVTYSATGSLGWDPTTADQQDVWDATTGTFSGSDETLTADIPPERTWGFEEGTGDWSVADSDFEQKSISQSGSFSDGIESDSANTYQIASTDIPHWTGSVNTVSFSWRETSASFGGAVSIVNSSGDMIAAFITANDEWLVTDPDASDSSTGDPWTKQVKGVDDNYGQWVNVRFTFDFANDTYDYHIHDEKNGITRSGSGVSLRNGGGDAEEIRFENYNTSWDSGGACHMWLDDFDLVYTEDRPNVYVMFAEDWNWGTVWDDPTLQTPEYDSLANDGMEFEDAYCSSPSCSPARSAILSGEHFWRTGSGSVLWGDYPDDLQSYPDLLDQAGYFVGRRGKGYGPGGNADAAGQSYSSFSDFLDSRSGDTPFCFWDGPEEAHRGFPTPSVNPDNVDVPPYLPDTQDVREDIAAYYEDVMAIDTRIGNRIQELKDAGELDNTMFIVTADHGFAFPRAKTQLYDAGTKVPLLVHWPNEVSGGQTSSEFVNFPDIAPTILEAAGVDVPEAMTGESFLRSLTAPGTDPRNKREAFLGIERHVPGQEPSDCAEGYPMRAIRTQDYLYIYNFAPGHWPMGTPDYANSCGPEDRWIANADNGPTKKFMYANRDRDDVTANDDGDSIKDLYDLAVAKRPQEELCGLGCDPHQLNNVAGDSAYDSVRQDLHDRLFTELNDTADPRVVGADSVFDYAYSGGYVTYPGDSEISRYEL